MSPLDDERAEPDDAARTSRRRAVGLGLAAVGTAWVAPTILSVDAAAAATQGPPPPLTGSLTGVVTTCGHELDPGDSFLVTATQNPGAGTGSDTTTSSGSYLIAGLPAGTYDVTLHPNGANTGNPDQTFTAAVVVVAGGSAFFNPDYQANGC